MFFDREVEYYETLLNGSTKLINSGEIELFLLQLQLEGELPIMTYDLEELYSTVDSKLARLCISYLLGIQGSQKCTQDNFVFPLQQQLVGY